MDKDNLERRWRNLEIWAAMQADERARAKANRPYRIASLVFFAILVTVLFWYGSTHF